jgi:autotransporter passenger strand-loop-strand repeat protein
VKLGRLGDVTVDQARHKAEQLRASVSLGADPVAERNKRRAVPTLADFARDRYGTTASLVSVGSGATEYDLAGGTASVSVVSGGGLDIVYSGGTASGTVVSSGGREIVSSGGAAVSTTVIGGGSLIVLPGGNEIGTTGVAVSAGVILVPLDSAPVMYAPARSALAAQCAISCCRRIMRCSWMACSFRSATSSTARR